MPVKRRGDAGVGERAHRIGRAGRAILRVLVVVEEDAVPLLLPPFRAGDGGRAPLDRSRQSQRRATHLGEGPSRMNPHIDVHAARPAGLGPSAKAHLFEQRLHLERDRAHVRPTDARAGIEIDA